ncbi:MAG: hydrolase [Microbacteriaceae bacterium]|nr:hydrolase [Microbacteriaceae bacterium]
MRALYEVMTTKRLPHFHEGSGAPLVVVPGLSGRRGTPARLRQWMLHQEVADFVGDRAVWSIDRRHDLEPGISIAEIAAEYAQTIDTLFDEPVDIMGISTGGSISLQLAADFPHLVKRLVLVSSAHRLSDHGRATQRAVAVLLRKGHARKAAGLFLANTGSTKLDHVLRGWAGMLAPRVVVGHLDPDLLATLDAEDGFDLEARLEGIEAPTLIAGGENDRYYSSELFERTSERMPHAQLSIYPGAGHLGTQGDPRLAREILTFLEAA